MNTHARKLGTLYGRSVYRFPVKLQQTDGSTTGATFVEVISHTARDAALLIRDELEKTVKHPTLVSIFGTGGGVLLATLVEKEKK